MAQTLALRTETGRTIPGLGTMRSFRVSPDAATLSRPWAGFLIVRADDPAVLGEQVTVLSACGYPLARAVIAGRRCRGLEVATLQLEGVSEIDDGRRWAASWDR